MRPLARHRGRIKATGTAGTTATPAVGSPPTVTWVTPAEGATVSGFMATSTNSGPSGPIEVSATDDLAVTRVRFYIDGQFLNEEAEAPWNGSLDTTSLPNGTHTLTAVAYDADGNTGSASRTINVQNTAVDPADKLTWAPPVLSNPVAIAIDSAAINARGSNLYSLDNSTDYQITLGDLTSHSGGIRFSGGRNLVVMKGHISVPWQGDSATIESRRALLFYRQVGTVHLEGTLIDNSGGDLSEGIQIDAPLAIIQIQNVRCTGIHARDQVKFSDNHPDLIQPYGGCKALRVDKFTGSSDSQGIYLRAATQPLGFVDLRRVNLVGTHSNDYRLLAWWAGETGDIPTALSDVWITPQPGDDLYRSVLAQNKGVTYTHTMTDGGNTASWPNYKDANGNQIIKGVVRAGLPPDGEFVPASAVGLNYASPGYL